MNNRLLSVPRSGSHFHAINQPAFVQRGFDPENWKPMKSIGAGVNEIRIREASGAYRVIYLASRPEAIYVLHCFQKKSEKTSQRDINLARTRFKAVPKNPGK